MKLLRHIVIGMGVVGFILAALTVLLFNRPALGWQLLSVPTGSMRPTMSPGSLVLIRSVPISSLKIGDVITHTNPLTMRSTLTHRIIKVYKMNGTVPAFVTKGDANPSPDPPVVGGLVQGRMVWYVPYVGRALMWAKTWTGIAALVYLPALIVMIHETRLLAESLRKMKPYRLAGWVRTQPSGLGQSMRPKWALAASTMFAVTIVITSLQVAGALAEQPPQTLLVLTLNVITASAPASASSDIPANASLDAVCTGVC